MSWKKHFRVVNSPATTVAATPTIPTADERASTGTSSKYSSYLPEVYSGHPNRIQRYYQYMEMDRDSDINAALDTIADFCTQSEEQSEEPFLVHFNDEANETEVRLLKTALAKWVKVNDFKSRLWHMFRNTIQNGDAFFLRDPETFEWLWIDHFNVEMVKVDDSAGKRPDEYIIRGLDYGKQAKFATAVADPSQYRTPYGVSPVGTARPMVVASPSQSVFSLAGSVNDHRQRQMMGQAADQLFVVDAKHVVHLSLSSGMDINWPFGQSVLEPVFKTYKQKELLEDAIIIYRVQRAPERRIFYIDVGNMPPMRAKAHIEQIKNEIHQRRIPNRTGGGASILDAGYNPLSVLEDYFFAQSADGRGSKVETLPGGEQVGEITDLLFFSRKLARGLRIPASYLSLGDDEGNGVAYNDGKLGQALIQEFRFNKYCMRIQNLLAPVFDREFKLFLQRSGIEIDNNLFEIRFVPPQSFTKYRQMEIDAQQVQVYQGLADNKKLSERFKLKRFLGLTEDEIIENERLWAEENASKVKKRLGSSPAENTPEGDLGSVGIRPTTDAFDLNAPPEAPPPGEGGPIPDMGGDMGAPPSPGGGATPPPPLLPAPPG